MKDKTLQIIVVATAAVVAAALYFGRTLPEKEVELPVKEKQSVSRSDVDGQIDSALSIIRGEAPMQGILMLREIAEQNPDNKRAYMELGAMSLQTGQYEKAKERFEHVVKLDSAFSEARYMLAVSQVNTGDTAAAISNMQRVLDNAKEEELLTQANKFITELQKH